MAMTDAAQHPRIVRLTTLVSKDEAKQIEERASMAGMSVSAYLRGLALEEEYVEKFDHMVGEMKANLDDAIRTVNEALERMERMDNHG